MKKQNQNGSALVVIIIIIIIALLGTLGFVLWQDLTKKSDTQNSTKANATQTTTTSATVEMKKGQIDPSFPVSLSWSYLESWSLTKKGNPPASISGSADETFTLTSPSKAYSVIYEVAQNLGFGGECSATEDPGTIQYINNQDVPNFSGTIFVESIVDNYSILNGQKMFEGYVYNSALLKDIDSVKNAQVGDSECDVNGLAGAIKLSSTPAEYLMKAQVRFNNVDQKDQYGDLLPVKDLQTIKNQYSSSEYKDAVNILVSTKLSE